MKRLSILALLLTSAVTVPLHADMIGTYIFMGTATGTLGANAFTNAILTVSGSADLNAIVFQYGAYDVDIGAAAVQISIAGLGTSTLSSDADIFVNPYNFGGFAGIESPGEFIEMTGDDMGSSAFVGYDLKSSLGPVGTEASDAAVSVWTGFATSAGSLTVTSYDNITFQAVVGQAPGVPEPGGLAPIMIGLLALAGIPVRQKLTKSRRIDGK